MDPRPFLSSLADFLLALAFLCYHYIFDSMLPAWLLTLTLYIISVAFKSILLQPRCLLEPENFLRVPKTSAEGLRAPTLRALQFRWCSLRWLFHWLCLVIYLILFVAGFLIYILNIIKIHDSMKLVCTAKKSNILFVIHQ